MKIIERVPLAFDFTLDHRFVGHSHFVDIFVGKLTLASKLLFNTQAVGMDSGVQFSLSNFIENVLQPTSSKMSPTSNLGL